MKINTNILDDVHTINKIVCIARGYCMMCLEPFGNDHYFVPCTHYMCICSSCVDDKHNSLKYKCIICDKYGHLYQPEISHCF